MDTSVCVCAQEECGYAEQKDEKSSSLDKSRRKDSARTDFSRQAPEDADLFVLAQRLHRELAQDRRKNFSTHEGVMLGSEVVLWLINNKRVKTEEEAVALGRHLSKLGLLKAVSKDTEFYNKATLYRVAGVEELVLEVTDANETAAEIDFWQQACQQGCEIRSASALLECVVSGRFADLVLLVQRVEIADLLVCLPMILRFMVASPFWIQSHVTQIQDSLKLRADAQKDLRQLAIFLRHAEWVPSTMLDKIAGTNRAQPEALESLQGVLAALGTDFEKMEDVADACELLHPFQLGIKCLKLKLLAVFKSNARPVLVEFLTESDQGICYTSGSPVIFKQGDDLRIDLGCLLVFKLFNHIWAMDCVSIGGTLVQALEYRVVPTTPCMGFIEFVVGCVSLSKIKDWKKLSPSHLVNLVASAAGAFIGSYVLGVRDRHSDNIIIRKHDGFLFHIDFGHVLGDAVTIDTGPFPITPELKQLMGPLAWSHFVTLCGQAFLSLRKHIALVSTFAELMLSSIAPAEKTRAFIRQVLLVDMPTANAAEQIRQMIEHAPFSYRTRIKNKVHSIAMDRAK